VNRRSTTTVPPAKAVNYPDVLGAITGNQRLSVNALQVATAIRPPSVSAGSQIEAVVLLQNTLNIDVDAVIHIILPDTDLSGARGRFSTHMTKPVRIGLRAGEVGYATFPVSVGHQVTPSPDYVLEVDISVEQKGRLPSPVRDSNGGIPFDIGSLSENRRHTFESISGLKYSIRPAAATTAIAAHVLAPFEVRSAAIAGLPTELKPNYIMLWSAEDFLDDDALVKKVKPVFDRMLPNLTHEKLFFLMLKATQHHFEGVGYRLWAGEAIAITKPLLHLIDIGVADSKNGQYADWFLKLSKAILDDPMIAKDAEKVMTETLYFDLITASARLAFEHLAGALGEAVGSAEEIDDFIAKLIQALKQEGQFLNMARVYMPLVLGGIITNTQLVMPQEQVHETASMIAYALEKRAAERDDENAFVFDLANDLVSKALEHF
jgi:hypothetical protein